MVRIALLLVLSSVACGSSADPPASAPDKLTIPAVVAPAPASAAAKPTPDAALDAATTARCEALRTKYLAWTAELAKKGIASAAPENRDRLQQHADEEDRWAMRSFVVACAAMGDAVDGSCFASELDREKRHTCQHMTRELRNRIADEQKLGRGEP